MFALELQANTSRILLQIVVSIQLISALNGVVYADFTSRQRRIYGKYHLWQPMELYPCFNIWRPFLNYYKFI